MSFLIERSYGISPGKRFSVIPHHRGTEALRNNFEGKLKIDLIINFDAPVLKRESRSLSFEFSLCLRVSVVIRTYYDFQNPERRNEK